MNKPFTFPTTRNYSTPFSNSVLIRHFLFTTLQQGHPMEVFRKIGVPQLCICWLEKEVLGSCWGKDFFSDSKLFSICSRSRLSRNIFVVRAIRSHAMYPASASAPRTPLKGKSEGCQHAHFDVRCIQMLLLCLLAGTLPPDPVGKRTKISGLFLLRVKKI